MTISINGINQSVPSKEDHGGGVQDITELKTVGPAERFDRQERYVEDETRPFYFDIQSVSAESLPDIVLPNDAPAAGRWIKLPQMMGAPALHAVTHTNGVDQIAAVTGAVNGLMTSADKTKLDGIGALANVTSVFGRTGVVTAVVGDYVHAEILGLGPNDHHAEAHVMGSGVHLADTLVALNAKITDATLVDTGLVVLTSGANPLTSTWDTGAFDIRTLAIRARAGQAVSLRGAGNRQMVVLSSTSAGLEFNPTATITNKINDVTILTVATDATIAQIAGAEPVSNVTGLDSRKIGFEGRFWAGAAVTRSTWLRYEDTSGQDDQGRMVFSTDEDGGAEEDYLLIYRNNSTNAANIQAAGSKNLNFRTTAGLVALQISGAVIILNVTSKTNDNIGFEHGTSGDYRWEYETANQTNNTLLLGTQGAEGNTVVLTDKLRLTLDHVVGTPSTPTFRYHDGSVTAGNFGSITHNGTNFVILTNAGSLILQDATGNDVIEIADANNLTISPAGNVVIATGAAVRLTLSSTSALFTVDLQPASGNLVLNDNTGTAQVEVRTTTLLVRQDIVPPDNAAKDIGNDVDGYDVGFFRTIEASRTGDLDLRGEDGATVVMSINNTGVAWFAGAPVAKAAALTVVDATAIDAVYGATEEAVLNNVRSRINDLESRLQAYNLLS